MSRNTNFRLNHRNHEQAYSDYWLAQNWEGVSDSHEVGLSKSVSNSMVVNRHPQKLPVDREALKPTQ
jgi:hypothetical protein